MNAKSINSIRADFLENTSHPFAVFSKVNDTYLIKDFNKSFSEFFKIDKLNIDINKIFINEKDEIGAILDNINNKEIIYIYNNFHNKCLEFTITINDNHYYFIASDCTKLQNLQTAWHQSEALYKAIFNSGTQAIVFLDKHGKIIAYNSYADNLSMKIFGFKLELNKKVQTLLDAEEMDNFSSNFLEALNGNSVRIERQIEINNSLGKEWFELIYREIKQNNANIHGVCIVISNITESKRYEQEMRDLITALKLANKITDENIRHIQTLNEELVESEAKLKEMNAKKDKFFSIISHDLKNPFQGFIGLTKELSENFQRFNLEELNEYFVSLHDNAKQLYKLLENLLLWSRVQRDSIDFKPEYLLAKDLINLNIDIQSININRKNVQVQNLVDSEIRVFADLNMLNTIIRNLLSNAIKFTHSNGTIIFDAEKQNNDVFISVTDSGVGMDADTIEKLFRIDQQHTTKGTHNESGTGLGLVLCQELVKKNNGEISIISELGKGTTFTVKLPIYE